MKWNRKRRKAVKMARRQKRDIYTARNPHWQIREIHGTWDMTEAFRSVYQKLIDGAVELPPEAARVLREGSWDLLD